MGFHQSCTLRVAGWDHGLRMQASSVLEPFHSVVERHPRLKSSDEISNSRMFAQGKTNRRRAPTYWLALELRIRSAYRQVERKFLLNVQSVKQQIRNCIERQPRIEEVGQEEPYFWVESYNAALLESDTRQVQKKVQSALRAVEQRRTCLRRSMNTAEWNLLQYAEIVLNHMAGTNPLRSTARQPRRSSATREKNAA